MKKLLFILFLFGQLFAQSPHAKTILKFVDNHMGKKVGDGLCCRLVQGAYDKADGNWKEKKYNNKHHYGEIIDSSEVQPGDVVLWDKLIRYDSKKMSSHIGIIYSIADGKIIVAEQNAEGNIAESKVVLTDYNTMFRPSYMESKEVTFYRLP